MSCSHVPHNVLLTSIRKRLYHKNEWENPISIGDQKTKHLQFILDYISVHFDPLNYLVTLLFSIYIICWILHAFLLVLSYDLLKDRRIDDVIIGNFVSLLYKTNRFHVAALLFSNRSQTTSKRGKNFSGALGYRLVSTLFLWSVNEKTHGNMEFIC